VQLKLLLAPLLAQATLWDAACKPIYDFGSGPWNMVRWNPFGRFLAIMGFGNLPGGGLSHNTTETTACATGLGEGMKLCLTGQAMH
jgi:hypothetical protein